MEVIRLTVDPERITVEDLLAIEDAQEGSRQHHCLVGLIGRAMVDEQGAPLQEGEALRRLKDLTVAQYAEVVKRYMERFEEVRQAAVPPARGGSS